MSDLRDISRRYVAHLIRAIEDGYNESGRLSEAHLKDLESMAPAKTRHFLNSLCSLAGARYLEVGLFKGGTFLCANHGNSSCQSLGIENFSEFQDLGHMTNGKTVEQSFLEQVARFTSTEDRKRMKVVRKNAFEVDLSTIFSANIYFYDGEHSARSHELALTHFDKALENPFILVVDDWSCQFRGPHDGTLAAVTKLGYRLKYFEELFFGGGDRPSVFAAVVEKDSKT